MTSMQSWSWSEERMRQSVCMARVAVQRSFDVAVPLEEAWRCLAEVGGWPEWAPHIRLVAVSPSGSLGPSSTGVLRVRRLGRSLRMGQGEEPRATLRMSAWEPPEHWDWARGLPWVRIEYDHRFEASGDETTAMTWVVRLDGPLAWLVRPVFAWIYGRNVDRAIPRLQDWIRT
jgi:hypothetical protein